jgi:hypothetical protein
MKAMMYGIDAGALANNSSVTDLRPTDTADTPYYYTFKVQCTSCRETHANWVGVSRHVGPWLESYDTQSTSSLLASISL